VLRAVIGSLDDFDQQWRMVLPAPAPYHGD
jgi:hypothetical protein